MSVVCTTMCHVQLRDDAHKEEGSWSLPLCGSYWGGQRGKILYNQKSQKPPWIPSLRMKTTWKAFLYWPMIAIWKKIIENCKTDTHKTVYINVIFTDSRFRSARSHFLPALKSRKPSASLQRLFFLAMDLSPGDSGSLLVGMSKSNSEAPGELQERIICYIWDTGSNKVSDFHIKRALLKHPFLQVCSSYKRSRLFIKLILPPAPSAAERQRTYTAAAFHGRKRLASCRKCRGRGNL